MYLRISRGRFEPARHDDVAAALDASQQSLIPAIRRLPGVLGYWAGIDRGSGTMVNVSTWETEEHARQMATLPEMLALRGTFEASGIRFEPMVNYEVLWQL